MQCEYLSVDSTEHVCVEDGFINQYPVQAMQRMFDIQY